MSDEKESNVLELVLGSGLKLEPSNEFKRGMTTYYDQRICNRKPSKGPIELPSAYQIGDAVESVLCDSPDGQEVTVSGYVYAVKFAANGSVAYDLAVPISGVESHYTVITDIRGGLRRAGSNDEPDTLVEVTPELKAHVRRSLISSVPEQDTESKH